MNYFFLAAGCFAFQLLFAYLVDLIPLPLAFAIYSFFFEGLTGLTITIGAIVTLALLMITTAKVNWAEKFASKPSLRGFPPPIPTA